MLTATVLGSGMAFLDSTVVTVALPAMGRELGAGLSGLQWIVNGYMVTLAALILLSGSLSDRFGRVRLFGIGVVVFALASALCAAAPTLEWMVAGRVVQGIGGALLTPGSLAILQAGFRHDDRARAIGAWSGLTGTAGAVGPFLGGWLVQIGDWRLIFLLNLPLAVAVLLIAWFKLPESRDPGAAGRLDPGGAVTAVVALGGVTYALIQWGVDGVTPVVLGAAGVGVLALVAFGLIEARSRAPMLPLDIFRSLPFTVVNAATVAIYGALGTFMFLLVLYLQEVAGYSPVAAGAASLPVTVLMLVLSSRSGALASRIGPRPQLVLGPVLLAIGFVLLSRLGADAPYLTGVLPAMLLIAVGLAATVAPLTATVLAAAPESRAGLASGVNNAVARTAQLIGVAAIPTLAGIGGVGGESVGGGEVTGLADGFATAMLVLAGLALAAAALSGLALPRGRMPDVGPAPETPGSAATADGARRPREHVTFCATGGPPLHGGPRSRADGAPDGKGADPVTPSR